MPLADILSTDARRAVENVRAAAARIWKTPLHRYYNDHTVDHSERIIALLDGLTAGVMGTDKKLSPGEVFVLLAAAYLHDIGMQNEQFAGGDLEAIRAAHHEQTAEMIYRVWEDPANAVNLALGDDPALVEAVALVAQAHREGAAHRKVDLSSAEYDPLPHGGETLRLRLLGALIRFADELDIDHRRVDLEQIKLMNLPVESQLHWCKCHYVSGVSIVDETIQITYRLPRDRPDYEQLIVPLVERDIRQKLADLEPIFRQHSVKVAMGESSVRPMRLVQPLPQAVEQLAREMVEGKPSGASHTGALAATPVTAVKSQKEEESMDIERKQELEELIVDSYSVICDWERIRQTGRPEEKLDARRRIKEQWDNIERYLVEYRQIVGGVLPGNMAQIAAHFGPVETAAPQTASSGQPPAGGNTYIIHHAVQSAIGDGAQVIQPAAPPAGSSAAVQDVDTAALRARLGRLDDVQIEALCLDHFPTVYDQLGRGQRRDEKMTLLLDHCRRNPEDAARLAKLL